MRERAEQRAEQRERRERSVSERRKQGSQITFLKIFEANTDRTNKNHQDFNFILVWLCRSLITFLISLASSFRSVVFCSPRMTDEAAGAVAASEHGWLSALVEGGRLELVAFLLFSLSSPNGREKGGLSFLSFRTFLFFPSLGGVSSIFTEVVIV